VSGNHVAVCNIGSVKLVVAGVVIMACGAAVAAAPSPTPPTLVRYSLTSWTEKDGLPSSHIRAIAQDTQGYLWLGTSTGLVRFDGIRFQAWEPYNEPAVRNDDVTALRASRDGSLWLGFAGAGGVSRIRLGRATYFGSSAGVPEGVIWAITEDRDGIVWAAGHGGLSRFDGDRWERVRAESGLPNQSITSLYQDRRGTLWVGTPVGIFRSDDRRRFELVESHLDPIHDFIEDSAGGVWVTDPRRGMRPMASGDHTRTAPAFPMPASGFRLLHHRDGTLWLATKGQGLWRARPTQPGTAMTVDPLTRELGLTSDAVTALLEDREGNIWIGTRAGLNKLSENRVASIGVRDGLLSDEVSAIAASDDGSLWVGTPNGLSRVRDGTQRVYDERHGLPSRTITALHYNAPQNRLWVATSRGVASFDGVRFEPLALPHAVLLPRVLAMTTDHDGGLWLCDTDKGVFRAIGDRLDAFSEVPQLGRNTGSSALTDRQGRVWLGFSLGNLGLYEAGTFRWFGADHGLGKVIAIHEDARGTIWIGTNRGLSRYRDGRLETLTHRNGLPGRSVMAVLDDADGNLWLGVSSGIVRMTLDEFDKGLTSGADSLQYTVYNRSDGLSGTPVAGLGYPTSARGRDGKLFFVTGNGLAVIDPRDQPDSGQPATVLIESLVADSSNIPPADRVSLPASTSKVEITYTALSFVAPSKIRFRYRLEGFDAAWVDAGARREAFYTNLEPGRYRFVVSATNADGRWNPTAATWEFSIAPEFHQTPWFFAMCVAIVGTGIWLAWLTRVRQLRSRYAVVFAERSRVGREIHDTLLQGLVGVALQFDAISEQVRSSPLAARERLQRVRVEVERYINEARQSIWDLRSPMLASQELPVAIRNAVATLGTGGPPAVEVAVVGRPVRHSPRIEEHVLRVCQEAVSNAIRHAGASQVQVTLAYRAEGFELSVSDDGDGFDTSDASTPGRWGLINMGERAQQVGGTLTIDSTPGRGTRILLRMPTVATT